MMMTYLEQSLKSPQSTARGRWRAALLAAAAIASLALPQRLAAGVVSIAFDADNFSTPTVIDNPHYPLVVGTTTVFRAQGADGCEEFRITVTPDVKLIDGVWARVVHDEAFEDPECDGSLLLVERTDDWFAQDDANNVWYMGEATEDCHQAAGATVCESGPGAWEAGVNGAKAGIIMLAAPKSGDQYYQEFAAGIAEDQAKVIGVGTKVSLTRDDAHQPSVLTGCLKTKEWTALDTGHVEHKYYCPGIGLVAVDELHGGKLRFELVASAAAASSDAFDFRTVP